jgi:hypothetical protein
MKRELSHSYMHITTEELMCRVDRDRHSFRDKHENTSENVSGFGSP